jgi:hypothetical protein
LFIATNGRSISSGEWLLTGGTVCGRTKSLRRISLFLPFCEIPFVGVTRPLLFNLNPFIEKLMRDSDILTKFTLNNFSTSLRVFEGCIDTEHPLAVSACSAPKGLIGRFAEIPDP